jgi:hypothetical protein
MNTPYNAPAINATPCKEAHVHKNVEIYKNMPQVLGHGQEGGRKYTYSVFLFI